MCQIQSFAKAVMLYWYVHLVASLHS